jgi:hypothetical protein
LGGTSRRAALTVGLYTPASVQELQDSALVMPDVSGTDIIEDMPPAKAEASAARVPVASHTPEKIMVEVPQAESFMCVCGFEFGRFCVGV